MATPTPTRGNDIYSGLLFQLIRESTPGIYDPNGKRTVMTQVKGDFVPEDQWGNFRPDGFNEDAWNALSKTHRLFNGTFQPDFSHIEVLIEMAAGVSNLARTNPTSDTVQDVFEPPAMGSRLIYTYTIERGTPASCERGTYGFLTAISMESDRDAANTTGSFTFACRKPDVTDVPMTGGVAQNSKYVINAANVTGDLVVTVLLPGSPLGQQVTIVIGDTALATKGKFEAITGVVVNVVGTIATGAGEKHTLSGTGNTFTVYGDTYDTATITPSTLQTAVRAKPGRSTATVTGTVTKPAPIGANLLSGQTLVGYSSATDTTLTDGNLASTAKTFGSGEAYWQYTPTSNITVQRVRFYVTSVSSVDGVASVTNSFGAASYALQTGGATVNFPVGTVGWVDLVLSTPVVFGPSNPLVLQALSQSLVELREIEVYTSPGITPGAASLSIQYDAAAGNVGDIEPVPGPGYVGTSTPPGGSGGSIAVEFTTPGNVRVAMSKTSGHAGYSVVESQVGSDGKFRIPKRVPIMPQMMSYREADTRAGLDTAPPAGKVKIIRWGMDSLATPEYFADENEISFQSHTDNADAKRTLGVKMAKSASLVPGLLAAAENQPSSPRWRELRWAHPDAHHLLRVQMLASVMAAVPLQAAGNVQSYEFPLGSVLTDTPGTDNSAAIIVRRAL